MALIPMSFRLETEDGRAAEYRIQDEDVEVRQLQPQNGRQWRRLSAEEIAEHVKRNTAVAKWLERRLGWRQLLRACLPEDHPYFASSDPRAASGRAA